jgi:hypothetical protein
MVGPITPNEKVVADPAMTRDDEGGAHGSGGAGGPGGAGGAGGGGGAGGPAGEAGGPVTIVVDGANVVGSRPDGWWRDRAGAAVRLYDSLARLAAHGAPGLSPEDVSVVLVLEGAAKAAMPRINGGDRADARRSDGDAPGTVRVVAAPRSGDDEIVRLAQSLPGRRIVVTADRELRRRAEAVGAEVASPSWLFDLL